MDKVASFEKFHPLFTYLKQETGLDFDLMNPHDLDDFTRDIKSGLIDFALQDPHVYQKLSHLYAQDSLLRTLNSEGGTSQFGVIIARNDSDINTVKDLAGKIVIFGSELSSAKWFAVKELLEESKVDIDKDLKSYSNGGGCEDVTFNVILKAADAAVVCGHFREDHFGKQKELGVSAQQIKVIAQTKPVPTKIFTAALNTDKKIVKAVSDALLKLDRNNKAHGKILIPAELGGFKRTSMEEYDNDIMNQQADNNTLKH